MLRHHSTPCDISQPITAGACTRRCSGTTPHHVQQGFSTPTWYAMVLHTAVLRHHSTPCAARLQHANLVRHGTARGGATAPLHTMCSKASARQPGTPWYCTRRCSGTTPHHVQQGFSTPTWYAMVLHTAVLRHHSTPCAARLQHANLVRHGTAHGGATPHHVQQGFSPPTWYAMALHTAALRHHSTPCAARLQHANLVCHGTAYGGAPAPLHTMCSKASARQPSTPWYCTRRCSGTTPHHVQQGFSTPT